MDIQTLTSFFGWCSVINGALFLSSVFFISLLPNVTYRLQSTFFPIERDTYDVIVYCFLGGFKLLYLFFNLVPYVALRIIA